MERHRLGCHVKDLICNDCLFSCPISFVDKDPFLPGKLDNNRLSLTVRCGGYNNDGADHTSCHLLDLWPISSAILMTQKQLIVDVEVVVTYKIRPDPDFLIP